MASMSGRCASSLFRYPQQPCAFVFNFFGQFLGLKNACTCTPADQPPLNLPEVSNLHDQINTPIRSLFDFVTRMPSALLDVWRLLAREANFHFLWLAPDHVECTFGELIEIEVLGNLESSICEPCRGNPFPAQKLSSRRCDGRVRQDKSRY